MSQAGADAAAVSGSAFPVPVRLAATGLVLWMLVAGGRVADDVLGAQWTFAGIALLGTTVAFVLWCLWWIWRSRTTVDGAGIRQTWMWDKRVEWTDVGQTRLVALPGLAWIVAPRLVIKVRGRPMATVIHIADPRVLEAALEGVARRQLGV